MLKRETEAAFTCNQRTPGGVQMKTQLKQERLRTAAGVLGIKSDRRD